MTFEHQSDYSIALSTSTVESWWRSHVVFKIHARTTSSQLTTRSSSNPPTLVGIARLSLRYVLKSRQFKLAKRLAVKDPLDSSRRIGTLHVSVELISELKEFATGLVRLRSTETTTNSKRSRVRSPAPLAPTSPHLPQSPLKKDYNLKSSDYEKYNKTKPLPNQNSTTKNPIQPTITTTTSTKVNMTKDDDFSIPIHMFLSINEGKINHQLTSNIYLICRLFWNKEKVRFEAPTKSTTATSSTPTTQASGQFCWTLNLSFVLQRSIVENMRNNFMIIEAWRQSPQQQQKIVSSSPGVLTSSSSTSGDSLVGTIKLSLHEFWLRFNEPSAVRAFFAESSMPLIGVDGWVSAFDPFTGDKAGEINTQLALGSQQQIINLQKFLFDKARKNAKIEENTLPKSKKVLLHLFISRLNVISHLNY